MYVESVVHFLSTEGAEFGLEILGALAAWADRECKRRGPGAAARRQGAALFRPAPHLPLPHHRCARWPHAGAPGSIPTGRAHRLPL
jgi:hypothetical protein